MEILITGATGLIGRELCRELLASGHSITVLSRNPQKAKKALKDATVLDWNTLNDNSLGAIDCVINLAGESIGTGRWTTKKKQLIFNSRINTTKAIVTAIRKGAIKPKMLVNASAIGYYGPQGNKKIDEQYPAGDDFLATVCKAWEYEAYKAEELGVGVAAIRTGVVLSKDADALKKMMLPFKFYCGGPVGTGQQWLSWIHISDLVKIFMHVIKKGITGPVNAAGPEPIKMRDFSGILGKVMKRPSWFPVPTPVLRLALGEQADLLVNSQRVFPKTIIAAGYEFLFPTVEAALKDIICHQSKQRDD